MFRPMQTADIEAVIAIEQAVHYHPWSTSLITDAFKQYHCFVLADHQTLWGYAMLKVVANEAELLNIAIATDHQKKGLGKLLLTQVLTQAVAFNAAECFLEVRESNLNAYSLYEKVGFNEVGRRTNYYPTPHGYEDALIMACFLE